MAVVDTSYPTTNVYMLRDQNDKDAAKALLDNVAINSTSELKVSFVAGREYDYLVVQMRGLRDSKLEQFITGCDWNFLRVAGSTKQLDSFLVECTGGRSLDDYVVLKLEASSYA